MELRVPAMPHMPATGVSGLDLYARRGRGGWHWLGSGRPVQFPVSDAVLVNDLPPGPERECLLYLPLYSSVEQVELGVPAAAELIPVPPPSAKPVVFYGTSIVQGGCASRPGMVHTAILGRWLNVSVINLGFSGNGQMEPEIAALLAELDPAVYVLDALPNMTLAWVRERAEAFLLALRRAHPATPILLVGQARFCNLPFFPGSAPELAAKDREFRSVVRRLERAGQAGFSWLPGQALWGSDGEATVDGIHPTDLGFLRMAQALRQPLRRLLAPPAEP
jgi:hypothetical protein